MGPDPLDRVVPEQLPEQGRATSHREADDAEGGSKMRVSSAGVSNGGDRLQGGRGLHHKEAEYGCTIYYDATNSGPL